MAGPQHAVPYEALSEAELDLFCILEDHSGIDQAEFTWVEESNPDACWRAYPFQWKWWRCTDPQQIDQCGRGVGKSLSIKARMFAFPFHRPGAEAVITAPELVHLEPIVGLIETQFEATRLGREMLPRGRSAITHRPFQANFVNGARIIGRIPQRDGKGVKGLHPVQLEHDEAQDYPKPGWTELTSTPNWDREGTEWRAHGVTRGIRDKFFEATQEKPGSKWKVHRYTAMSRPGWSDEERASNIAQYGGSRDDPDYRRNVLGLHGDATNPIFVLHRLMRGVDDNESSAYNLDEYAHIEIKTEELEESGDDILDRLVFPQSHKDKYKVFWIGQDVGYTHDPTEILVFGEYMPTAAERREAANTDKGCPAEGLSRLKLLSRITLWRISNPLQVRAVLGIVKHYRPKAFSVDKTGAGLPLFQDLQAMFEAGGDEEFTAEEVFDAAKRIKGYNFSEKVIVDIDETIELDEFKGDPLKDAAIEKNVLEYSTDVLRSYVDRERLLLPYDNQLVTEFQGQTYSYTKSGIDSYGRRRRTFSEGRFHALDAARMAVMGHAQESIEELVANANDAEPVLDVFVMA